MRTTMAIHRHSRPNDSIGEGASRSLRGDHALSECVCIEGVCGGSIV